jgi:hypothetical protein
MSLKKWLAAGTAVVGSFCCCPIARADNGYEALSDWSALPNIRAGEFPGLASSYNRGGDTINDYNNFDNGNALQPDDLKLVRQITGPGLITRFWMPHLAANNSAPIRVFVDGQLLIDTNSVAMLGGTYGPGPQFRTPFLQTRIGGQVSYEPIPFQQSLVIESSEAGANFYQWNYRKLPAGSVIPSYNGTLTPAQTASRTTAVNMLGNVGQNPAGTAGVTTVGTTAAVVAPLTTVPLANLSGSGQIRGVTLHMPTGAAAPTDAQLTALRVRVKYEGATGYAIDVPFAHFFGAGSNRTAYQSLPMGANASNGTYYCYWPMPFRAGATVELYNDGTAGVPVPIVSTSVDYAAGPIDPTAGYLHAVFQSETTTAGQASHNLLHAGGSGRYVGNLLFVRSSSFNTLEGNDLITVNGDTANAMHGTGLEDAYNGGYYYNSLGPPFSVDETGTTPTGPYNGLLALSGPNADQYRWMVGDYVPFANGIDVSIENVGGLAGVQWGSTAFYYSNEVPEPASAGLLGGAVISLLGMRCRRTHRF